MQISRHGACVCPPRQRVATVGLPSRVVACTTSTSRALAAAAAELPGQTHVLTRIHTYKHVHTCTSTYTRVETLFYIVFISHSISAGNALHSGFYGGDKVAFADGRLRQTFDGRRGLVAETRPS